MPSFSTKRFITRPRAYLLLDANPGSFLLWMYLPKPGEVPEKRQAGSFCADPKERPGWRVIHASPDLQDLKPKSARTVHALLRNKGSQFHWTVPQSNAFFDV